MEVNNGTVRGSFITFRAALLIAQAVMELQAETYGRLINCHSIRYMRGQHVYLQYLLVPLSHLIAVMLNGLYSTLSRGYDFGEEEVARNGA